jgi:hypothetical protein
MAKLFLKATTPEFDENSRGNTFTPEDYAQVLKSKKGGNMENYEGLVRVISQHIKQFGTLDEEHYAMLLKGFCGVSVDESATLEESANSLEGCQNADITPSPEMSTLSEQIHETNEHPQKD